MRGQKSRRAAQLGMLFALAIALSFAESAIAPLLGLMPAIKLGLSNIVVMYALLGLGRKQAAALAVLKALFAFLTRGFTAGALSFLGGACSLAVMMLGGYPISTSTYVGFIMMLGITMVAAPGVPGGAIMAALGILQTMLGFNETLQALMIALYIAMDSFGTACNVTGDGAIAVIVDRIAGERRA